MEFKHILVSLVAVLALFTVMVGSVSAFVSQPAGIGVEVNGVVIPVSGTTSIAAFAGQTVPVRITFTAAENAIDVRVKAEISGGKGYDVVSERFDVIKDQIYSRLVNVEI